MSRSKGIRSNLILLHIHYQLGSELFLHKNVSPKKIRLFLELNLSWWTDIYKWAICFENPCYTSKSCNQNIFMHDFCRDASDYDFGHLRLESFETDLQFLTSLKGHAFYCWVFFAKRRFTSATQRGFFR